MNRKSPSSGKRQAKHFVEKNVKTTNLKSKAQVPRCHSLTPITVQLRFDFDEPTYGNSKQPSTSGASSEIKPKNTK